MIKTEILEELGWYINRKVDLKDVRKHILAKGYSWSNIIELFLIQFAFLEHSKVHFNVFKAENDIDPSWIQKVYSNKIGKTEFCVIGQAYNNHMTLFMDTSGEIYGGFDESLYLIGNDYISAIENIYFDKPLTEL